MTKPLLRDCECGVAASALEQPFADGETDFRLCPACGLVFRTTFPTPVELAEIYRQAYEVERIATGDTNQESGSFATASYVRYVKQWLGLPAVQPGFRIFDYGAGSGELVASLRGCGLHADGLEFAPAAREYCLQQRGFELRSSLHDIADSHYTAATLIEVIEHLTDLQASLLELRRILVPGGRILVTTPNRRGLRARLEGGRWREASKKFHLFLFDAESLRFHLDLAGFMDIQHVRFSPLQRPGTKFWLSARTTQLIGLSGTLCMVARSPGMPT